MLKVIIFTAIFVGLLCLYVYFRQVVVMRSQGGMSRKYKVLVDFILGLDKKYEIWEEADFSMKIGYSNANHKLSVQGFSGGGKIGKPFFEILQQYGFVVINYHFSTAEGKEESKVLTFKEVDDQHSMCTMLSFELKNLSHVSPNG